MPKYRPIITPVEAVKFTGENFSEVQYFFDKVKDSRKIIIKNDRVFVKEDFPVQVHHEDYIVRQLDGSYMIYEAADFEQTFERDE